jgi:Tfp pilus assembly protein FimT
MQTSRQAGFSIIEILTIIGIIVLLAAIALPYFASSNQHTKLKGDAQALVSDFRLAQQRTIGEQTTYLIKLYSSPQKYLLIKRSGGTDTVIKERSLSAGIVWQNLGGFTDNEVVFTTTGAVVQAGTITLSSPDGQQSTVEIKPSGYVRTD